MNSNKKFDFYKNAIYFLIASAVMLVTAIVILCIFGFNYGASVAHGKMIFGTAMVSILSLAIILVYIGVRYDWAKALTIVLVSAHNLLLSTALICLIRVPVTEALLVGYALLIALTAVYTLLMTNKIKDVNFKKDDFNDVIKSALSQNIKRITMLSLIVVCLMFLSLIAFSASVFSFVRLFLVMLVVLIYSIMIIALPIWCFLSTKIKKVKRAKVDTNVDNQRVVKAASLGDGEPTQTADEE